jgi:hypothetical protein
MKTKYFRFFLLFIGVVAGACHAGSVPEDMFDTIWETIKVFEGSANTISGDFDCQGMSIGEAQWNVGKSFKSAKEIVSSVPLASRISLIPTHGRRLEEALTAGQEATIAFVRSIQVIADTQSCDAKKRAAHWSAECKIFVAEFGKVLSRHESIAIQRQLRRNIFIDGNQSFFQKSGTPTD